MMMRLMLLMIMFRGTPQLECADVIITSFLERTDVDRNRLIATFIIILVIIVSGVVHSVTCIIIAANVVIIIIITHVIAAMTAVSRCREMFTGTRRGG